MTPPSKRKADNKTAEPVLLEALKHITSFDCAIDGGAHDGFVTNWMVYRFSSVYAFEPGAIFEKIPMYRPGSFIHTFNVALGDKCGEVAFNDKKHAPRSSRVAYGKKVQIHLREGKLSMVDMITIDSLNIAPDFIKLDLEGYEIFAIRGGEKTIKEHRPVILLEYKHEERYGEEKATDLLEEWGYQEVAHIGVDKIYA